MAQNHSVRAGLGDSLVFTAFRRLEQILSPAVLYRLMAPFVRARVAFKRVRSKIPLPDCLGGRKTFQISSEQIRKNYLNAMLGESGAFLVLEPARLALLAEEIELR